MKIILLATTLLFSSFVFLSCKKDNPILPGDQPQLNLTLEDVSCTEAWIKLTTANISLPADVELLKDDNPVKTISLISADTILYIDSLLPNHTYKYQSVIQSFNQSSNPLTFATMDTTSHNFTWQTWTFGGQAGSCTLYDVAIIDENDIWAVGEIYLLDTTGVPDPNAYNAVHWDGSQWELKRIKTNACGGVDYPPIKAIFAFSSDDILFAHIDGSITHYNGIKFTNDCSLITQLNGSATKIWGVSQNNYYGVSGNGFIAHYQNGQWSRIESGTDLNIYDIWGDTNDIGQFEIICIASTADINKGNKIIKIIDNESVQINNEGLPWSVQTIWFIPNRGYFIGGDGLYYTHYLGNKWLKEKELPSYYKTSISGSSINNIIVVGAFGLLLHFNGLTWKNYQEYINGAFSSVQINKNIVICVGGLGNGQALIKIGNK